MSKLSPQERELLDMLADLRRRVARLETKEYGEGGAVDSVNGQTGVVALDADDIDDTSTTNKFATDAELTKLAGIEAGADVTDADNVASAGAVMDSELIASSAGAGDAGKPIKLDVAGHIDATMINDGDIDHGSIGGLADDDHTQYHNDARGDARYAPIAKGVTNGDSHDHSGGDGSQIDHGGLAGLGDDDHTHYALADGTRAFTGVVTATGINLGEDTLSIYDEGTWTPAITGSTTNPTLTYVFRSGGYWRVNDLVFYYIQIIIDTVSVAGSGDLQISLPITAVSNPPGNVRCSGLDIPGTPYAVAFLPFLPGAYGRFITSNDNAGASIVSVTAIASGDQIAIAGFYGV